MRGLHGEGGGFPVIHLKKKKEREKKSLVGGTIQIRGPLLQTLERQELHTLGGPSGGGGRARLGEDPCPFSPVGGRGLRGVGGEGWGREDEFE